MNIFRQLKELEIKRPRQLKIDLPPIVCLCGSTKFLYCFEVTMLNLTLCGYIVLSLGSHRPIARRYADNLLNLKARLDTLHKHKIDLSDVVLVLNVGGYIGESTRSEIDYAISKGVPVCYLETPPKVR